QLLADTSHELRTPLTTIRGNLDLLERGLDSAERDEVLHETRDEVDRMSRLVRDLLLLGEAGSRAVQFDKSPHGLGLLLEYVLVRLSLDRLEVDAEPVTLMGDEDRLRQMITNLVENAARHGSHVRVVVRRRPPHVELVVEDDGPGVPPEALERVFDRFFRLD